MDKTPKQSEVSEQKMEEVEKPIVASSAVCHWCGGYGARKGWLGGWKCTHCGAAMYIPELREKD